MAQEEREDTIQKRYRYKDQNTLYYMKNKNMYLFNFSSNRFEKFVIEWPMNVGGFPEQSSLTQLPNGAIYVIGGNYPDELD